MTKGLVKGQGVTRKYHPGRHKYPFIIWWRFGRLALDQGDGGQTDWHHTSPEFHHCAASQRQMSSHFPTSVWGHLKIISHEPPLKKNQWAKYAKLLNASCCLSSSENRPHKSYVLDQESEQVNKTIKPSLSIQSQLTHLYLMLYRHASVLRPLWNTRRS